jgi:hypothetical protein
LDDFFEQPFLAVEIHIKRSLRNTCDPSDFAHAPGVEALSKEYSARAVENLAPLGTFRRFRQARCLDRHFLSSFPAM